MSRVVVSSVASVLVASTLGSCAGITPTQGLLPSVPAPSVAPVIEHTAVAAIPVNTADLSSAYAAAGRPTIGFVRGSYQLPVANPLGAARILEGNLFGVPYQQSLVAPSTYRPFAIVPLENGFDTQQLALVQQELSQAGVRFVEVNTADALRIAEAEKQAVESNTKVQFNEMTRAGSDVLVSYQASQALGGPIYIVRVIRMTDGALLALRTGPGQGGAVALRPLLVRAIADALQAAAAHPLAQAR